MRIGFCTFFGHKYSEWHNTDEHTCIECKECTRCHHRKCREGEHIFGNWSYEYEFNCKQVKICLRCGTKITRTQHTFGDWIEEEYKSFNRYRICSRCGYTEYM